MLMVVALRMKVGAAGHTSGLASTRNLVNASICMLFFSTLLEFRIEKPVNYATFVRRHLIVYL